MSHWPLEPLMALARTRDGDRMSMKELSLALGMAPSSVQHWKERGIPSDEKAEKAAVLLGFDPYVVWPEWAETQWLAATRPCARCGERFILTRPDRLYCSKTCKDRVAHRRWLQTPAGKRYAKAQRRRFYVETAEYQKKRAKARYWENHEAELERLARYREANRELLAAKARERRARKKAERQALAQATDNTVDSGVVPGLSASDGTVAA